MSDVDTGGLARVTGRGEEHLDLRRPVAWLWAIHGPLWALAQMWSIRADAS